ncbi:MAG TPA: hypothetical protein VFN11_21315 [Ktedonobacterales bacterium]|nr:hypothetical protein [Ktedonobacterales bacterium]
MMARLRSSSTFGGEYAAMPACSRLDEFQKRYHARMVTVAFTTFAGAERLVQMRQWIMDEVAHTKEAWAIGSVFAVARLPKSPTPEQAWLESYWYLADAAIQGHVLLTT